MKRKRIINFAVFSALLLTEVLIALFIHDSFIRPYAGDMLVVAVVYFFLRILIPEKYAWLPAAVFAFAVLVEVSQYFRLAELLGITNPVLKVVLGAVYDTKDIVCYGIGCIFLAGYEWIQRKKHIQL